jgi:hypothetical protein
MDILDVPELLQIPDPAPYDENPIATADYLLTMLFRQEASFLHAEFLQGDGAWYVCPRIGGRSGPDEVVARSETVGRFRAVLARFGHYYMGGQVYHGYAQKVLRQAALERHCHFYLSNAGYSGYWIRVYANVG